MHIVYTALSSSGKSEAGFWVMFFMCHYVVPTILYDSVVYVVHNCCRVKGCFDALDKKYVSH